MKKESEVGILGIIDVTYLELQRRDLIVFDRNPIWRWFWNRLRKINIEVEFVELAEEHSDQLNLDYYDTILIYIDNIIPMWIKKNIDMGIANKENVTCYFCGYLPTRKENELMREYPFGEIIEGTMEQSLGKLCRKLYESNGIKYEKEYDFPNSGNIDELDVWAYRKQFLTNNVAIIQSSVGCPRRCLFCRYSEYYHTYACNSYVQYPMQIVVEQIEEMICKFHIHYFRFLDSNFLGVGNQIEERVDEFVRQIYQHNVNAIFAIHCRSDAIRGPIISRLKAVGLRYVTIGIESMSETQLARLGKQELPQTHWNAVKVLKDEGIHIQAYIILADPLVTRAELIDSLEGICELCKFVQIVMNEKMVLYSDSLYYKKYSAEIIVNGKDDETLGNVLQYDFKDVWCKKNFAYAEKISESLKKIIVDETKSRKVNEGFVRKATFYRMKALLDIVKTDIPNEKNVSGIIHNAERQIRCVR